MSALALVAGHGRILLVLGLLVGCLSPGLAGLIRPWLQELVALLLLLAAVRINPDRVSGFKALYLPSLALTLLNQLILPLLAIGVFRVFGLADSPAALAVVLMLAAPPVSGGPHLSVMSGADPAPALRLLILGTAMLPLTVLPVFGLLPALGEGSETVAAAGRLLLVVLVAVGLAVVLRLTVFRTPAPDRNVALDGFSAIVMAVVVVGLMTSVGPALRLQPLDLLGWLALASLLNFGLQFGAALMLDRAGHKPATPARAIVTGNRNIALFLVALPPEVSDQILMFIGCYQVPMYLTPILMRGFYRRWTDAPGKRLRA